MNKILNNCIRSSLSSNGNTFFSTLSRHYSYKSDISLDVLYPQSRQTIFTPPPPPPKANNKFNGYIPINQLKITYSRSSGPGGQNVNCVDTKVDIRFHVASVDWLSDETKKLLVEKQRGRITKDGYFVIKNDATRFQQTNLADGLEAIRNIIRKVEQSTQSEPSPESVERHRRNHEKATRERLMIKRQRSMTKADRRGNDTIV
ncbi:peptidyl-tRNA hydrolase ICT1, mitochondrial [Bradysia coprophila]|uniref:peptidyl-tRNA hydrolase ICT1, mitochondrial n=1 Tax=Bradysia coprophila TaxID=38358 RepID=UPI00187DADA2|nr:peptidyl-tRNA hydrolase ICT1, mitochondrial [Bradysia coprophila]